MISVGDTFVWKGNGFREHLYVALNSSTTGGGNVAVVNITESKGGTAAMVLRPGQHPYIIKNSDVNFGDAYIVDSDFLEGEVKAYSAFPNASMDHSLVEKLAAGAHKHPGPERDLKKLLEKQWPMLPKSN